MTLLLWFLACDGSVDSGVGEVALSDESVVPLTLSPSFNTLHVAAEADATFEWSTVTMDWLGNPFDATTETHTVEFIRAESLDTVALALTLVRDELTQDMVELYGWEKGAGPYESATVSELEDHTPAVKPSHLVAGRPWLLLLRDADEAIRLAVEVDGDASLAPSDAPYPVTDGMSTLAASATLDGATVWLGSGDTLAWDGLTMGSDGGRFDASRATYLAAAPSPGEGEHSWSTLADAIAGVDPVATSGATRMSTPPAVAEASPGATFLVALDCSRCEPLFPAAMFVVERE